MRTLVKGGIIVTVDTKRRVIEDGFIRIEDGVITGVGKVRAGPNPSSFDDV